MNHVKILGVRSIVLAAFVMTLGVISTVNAGLTIVLFGGMAAVMSAVYGVSARVTPGPHQPFVVMMAVISAAVAAVAIVGGVLVGPHLLPWTLLVFGVLTGVAEIGAALRSEEIPRGDHLVLGGASLMLALASLVRPLDQTWLSGTIIGWAAIGAVLTGIASVNWKDQIRAKRQEESES
jgi:hypothetical protein